MPNDSAWSNWVKRKFSRQGLSEDWDQTKQRMAARSTKVKEYTAMGNEKARQGFAFGAVQATRGKEYLKQWNQDRKDQKQQEKEERERQEAEETRRQAQEAEQDQIRDQGARQEAREEADEDLKIKELNQREQAVLKDTRSNFAFLLAFILSLVDDAADLAPLDYVPFLGPAVSIIIDVVVLVGYYLTLGSKVGKNLLFLAFLSLLDDIIGLFTSAVGGGVVTEFVGMGLDACRTLMVLHLWGQSSAAHSEAANIHKEIKVYKEKIKRTQDKKAGKTYQEPSAGWTLALLILTGILIVGILTGFLADPTTIIITAGPLILLWVSFGILGIPRRLSWNMDLSVIIVKFILIVGSILFAIFFIIPAFYGCITSGQCEQMLKEGIITTQIATQQNPIFYYLWPGNWPTIFQHQLATAGFQPEGQAETQKVGIRITKIGTRLPSGGIFHEGDPATVYITLLSTLYYPVTLQHSCTLSATTLSASATPFNTLVIGPADSVDPATTNLYETKEQTVTCTWNNLKKGTYKATYTGSMISTTNAFVTLTFIEQQSMESFRSHEPNLDLNKFLFIDPVFKPLYTNGPITLQIDRITQPIALDLGKPRTISLNIFLESNWTDGKIEHADQFTFYVPNEMQLQQKPGCDGFSETASPIQEYTAYTAPYNKIGRATETLQRLTCDFVIPDAKKILTDKPKALKTIAMEISYKYSIHGSTSFTVRT